MCTHAQALFEIKHSSQKLEEVLKEVNKFYSKDLCQTIRSMLRRKFQVRVVCGLCVGVYCALVFRAWPLPHTRPHPLLLKNRPSSAELIQLPFVRSCLELSKSELVDQDRKRAAPENTVKPTTTKK